ncbi:hypothetical protein MHU86_10322 [Fragilaria crotonensis]|nr:hypothetical protein MHU86_10322 [Fragilaria crotonensis]
MDLLSPDVLEGYDNEDDLKADLAEAVKFFINGFIEDQIQYGRYTYIYEGPMMDVGAVAEGDEATADNAASAGPPGAGGRGESAAGATDFETNNQVDGVDEADMVKSDGTYVYAVYGDAVVVWEAATGAYVTNYTLPPIAESNVRARELRWLPMLPVVAWVWVVAMLSTVARGWVMAMPLTAAWAWVMP